MECKQVLTLLDDYIDGMLNAADASRLHKHCESCNTCAAELERNRLINNMLADLPVPEVSPDFEKRVIRQAIKNADVKRSPDNGLIKFMAAAMISAVVVFFGLFDTEQVRDTTQLVAVSSDVRTIKVAIDSEHTLEAVKLRVELSNNLELAGFGNRKHIDWTTRLRPGVNIISLPILGIAQGQGDITTRVMLNGKEKIMHIKTQFKNPGNVLLKNDMLLVS